MTNTIGYSGGPRRESGILRKLLVIFIPIGILLAFIVAMFVIIALNKKPEEKRSPFNPLAVFADEAVMDDIQLVVKTQGEARPRVEIDLVPEVSGKITYVSPKFIDGGIFAKGDTLIQIDKRDYEVAVIRAEAGVARAQQVLVREKAEAEIARRDWEDLGEGAPSDLTLRKPQMAEAQASLQSAQADLQNAKIQLSRTSVRAPFNGRVRSKSSDLGQYATPGTRLGRIFSTDIFEVRLPLTDDDLKKVNLPIAFVAEDRETAPDVKFSVVIGGQLQEWTGKIMRTDSVYDTQTRALFAIAEVNDPYGEGRSEKGVPLAPGLFVDAEIKGKTYENVIVLPRDGLRPENKVYIANDDGSANIITAGVLDTTTEYAYVTDGVSPGDYVILSPMEVSRAVGPLKVLDIKDPKNVLIDPPKPDWLIEKEKAQDEARKDKKKKNRKKDKETETSASDNETASASAKTSASDND